MNKQKADAFDELVRIAQGCRKNAHALPAEDKARLYWRGIGFRLRGHCYLCPLDEVAEILMMPTVTRLPGIGGWVSGVANIRGRLLAVLDMALFFYNQSIEGSTGQRRILVLENNDIYSGLVVDEVMGMQHCLLDGYSNEPERIEESLRPFVDGGYEHKGVYWGVFRPTRLLSDVRFMRLVG